MELEEFGIVELSESVDCLSANSEDLDMLIRGAVANTNCNSC
ncbi:hypothetical protein [Guptibacillus sedimenti]|nr:hypothetical protein [Pseudalkalibacillus sedimenti]